MPRVQAIVLASALYLLFSVLNLVRRRQLREEYSWLWLLGSIVFVLVAVSPAFHSRVAQMIGATNATAAFTFLGFYFLAFLSIQFSVVLSRLTTRSKDLAQQIAILDGELRRLTEGKIASNSVPARRQTAVPIEEGQDGDGHTETVVVSGGGSAS